MRNQNDMEEGPALMFESLNTSKQSCRIKRYTILLGLLWTAVIVISAGWALHNNHHFTTEAARIEAQATFNKDLLYRRWASLHGGVYVPVTEETQPNPYLTVEHRDIMTTDGQMLTLINPAYMTRQVHELAQEQDGIQGHITSLDPIRPANAPDEWEVEALLAFEDGVREVTSIETLNGEDVLRYMQGMVTEESCLVCHAFQGYEVGDIRGGISVSVPMEPYWASLRPMQMSIFVSHSALWLMGIMGIGASSYSILRSVQRGESITQQLRESEARYRMLTENAHDVIYRVQLHPEMRFEYVSPSVTQMTGYSPQDHYDDPQLGFKLVHPDDQKILEAAAQGQVTRPIILRWVHRDGSIIWTEQVNRQILDADGKLVALEGIARDITERKQAEDALRTNEERLRAIVDNMPLMLGIISQDGVFEFTNQYWVDNLGWSAEELAHVDDPFGLFYPDLKARQAVLNRIEQDTDHTAWVDSETHTRHRGVRTTTWIDIRLSDGRTVGIGQDVTEIRQAQKREQELALEASRRHLLTTFIQDAAHEFRTPLSTISSSAYLMARSEDAEHRKSKAHKIQEQISQITRLVDTLLLTVQLESSNPLHSQPVDMIGLLASVCEDVTGQHCESCQPHLERPANLPPVPGDVYLLADAFGQILDNACRHTPDDSQVNVIPRLQGDELWVDIHDDGPGIDEALLPHIFETFWRQNNAHTTPGFGLGLSISQRIIERHGGRIEVESQVGNGTCFRVVLPVSPVGT